MNSLPPLILDLGIILITAACTTLILKRFKQPVVLGYLLAGFLLGQNFPFFIGIEDTKSIHLWAEIGVIILLFGLGLEFSFKKISHIGKSAGIASLFESGCMMIFGFFIGKAIGWNVVNSLYLGGMLSISSTAIIVRAFDELDLKGKKFVSLVFGILVFEDFIAVLALVLLTTFGLTSTFSGEILTTITLKLIFFLVLWFLVGIYFIPLFLKFIRNLLNPEMKLIVSLALCFLMAIIVTDVGFSAPLGAFIMGSILAETREGKKIESLIAPIKNLFSAVFFVSVGLMIRSEMIYQYGGIILLITFLTISGKIFFVTLGSLISGQSLKMSLYAGMSMAQIGEFSFVIATLGKNLKITDDALYPIAVSVSAITIFTTPYLIKTSPAFYNFIYKRIPTNLKNYLNNYETIASVKNEHGILRLLWKAYGIRLFFNLIIVIGIILLTERLILVHLYHWNSFLIKIPGLGAFISLILSFPFLWAILLGSHSQSSIHNIENVLKLKSLLPGITFIRTLIGFFIILMMIGHFTNAYSAYLIALILLILISTFFKKYIAKFYHGIETKFINNLNDKNKEELAQQKATPVLTPWDAAMTEFIVSPDSIIVGKTLQGSRLKEQFHITIALIERGSRKIMAPLQDTLLMPYDRLFLIGKEHELISAKKIIEENSEILESEEFSNYGLQSFTLSHSSPYINKTIRDCGLRKESQSLIVGVERRGARFLNPESSMILLPGDLLWLVTDLKNKNLNFN